MNPRPTRGQNRWWYAAAMVAAGVLGAGAARADRRAPFGNDAQLLEAKVREDIEHRIAPLLEQMAPGQAELKYVDVRVARPTALPSGAAPGFEELTPGTEFVAEKAEVSLVLDAKLPPPFRKDLKTLIKNRLDALAVPVDIQETVIAFPTPRPQPQGREPLPYAYPPAPREAPAAAPTAAAATPPAPPAAAPVPAEPTPSRGAPWLVTIVLALLTALIGGLAVALAVVLSDRRNRRREAALGSNGSETPAGQGGKTRPEARAPSVDHLPEVRRALREDRVLARRVMAELLRENQLETVAVAVELVGPTIVEDLRADPTCAVPLREAAALLVAGQAPADARDTVEQLHRRILKHRMVGAEDPVEQEFAFLLGLSPARLGAVLAPEPPAVQAAGLRYAPVHLRSAYLAERSPGERAALAAALAGAKSISKEHLLDVAATLRARAAEQAHLDSGETGDIELAIELVEERPAEEQAGILEAMRRADPAKARAVEAALITDGTFERVSDEVLVAAAMARSQRFAGAVPSRCARSRGPAGAGRTAAHGGRRLEEELSLEVAPTPSQIAQARRAAYAALRKVLRERGLASPGAIGGSDGELRQSRETRQPSEKGKVVAI